MLCKQNVPQLNSTQQWQRNIPWDWKIHSPHQEMSQRDYQHSSIWRKIALFNHHQTHAFHCDVVKFFLCAIQHHRMIQPIRACQPPQTQCSNPMDDTFWYILQDTWWTHSAEWNEAMNSWNQLLGPTGNAQETYRHTSFFAWKLTRNSVVGPGPSSPCPPQSSASH